MADEPTTPEPAKTPDSKPDDSKTLAAADKPDAVKAALDAERAAAKEARKRAEDAEAKVKEFEDRNKSEAEKAAEKAAQAERRATEAETKLMRVEIASKKGLDADMAARLVGETREELEADAAALAKKLKAPTPGFDGGARDAAPDLDVDARIRRMAGRA